MTKEFCDRCGELISFGNYKTGDHAHVMGAKDFPERTFYVEIKINYQYERNWKLCAYCANEIIDEAHKKVVEARDKEGGFDKMREAAK